MMKNFILTLGSCLLAMISHRAVAQNIDIDFIEFVGRNVVVHYSLDDGASSTRQFLVQLYSSQDNFTTPLTRVTGDFGTEVSAGFDKKIVWDVSKELGAFDGKLSLELRGRVYVPFVKIKDIGENQEFKRGKNYPLNWSSGNLSGLVNIELFNKAGERVWGENNVANVGKFDWFISGSTKRGNGYTLKFTNAKDRNDVVFSKPFIIKPKIPLLVKVGAAAIVAGAIGYFMGSKSSASDGKPFDTPPVPH